MSEVPELRLALACDDRADPLWAPLVLDALGSAGAGSTLFVVAPLDGRYPRLLSRMREAGHEIAFQCARHVRHDRLTPRKVAEDARVGFKILEELRDPVRHWRTPWGLVTPATSAASQSHGGEI